MKRKRGGVVARRKQRNMDKKIYGLTKGTDLEKTIAMVANAEANGTKQYYAMARMAREQGLPEALATKLEELADQESTHAGFYATLNAEVPGDLFGVMERMAKGEYGAQKVLQPLADQLRAMGSEAAASQCEAFIRQETHHGEVLDELLRQYRK